ncbi:MAG: hypothetical protein ACOX5Z_08770 [Desulfobulbus sp.]|jgi:hypothetical protein
MHSNSAKNNRLLCQTLLFWLLITLCVGPSQAANLRLLYNNDTRGELESCG